MQQIQGCMYIADILQKAIHNKIHLDNEINKKSEYSTYNLLQDNEYKKRDRRLTTKKKTKIGF